jgi:hypothetical protein
MQFVWLLARLGLAVGCLVMVFSFGSFCYTQGHGRGVKLNFIETFHLFVIFGFVLVGGPFFLLFTWPPAPFLFLAFWLLSLLAFTGGYVRARRRHQ